MRPLRFLGALALALCVPATLVARSAPEERPIVARVGVNLPTMGIVYWQDGRNWRWSVKNYFSAAVMSDVKNELHADYVRTGFIPDWVHRERPEWLREDRVMDDACRAGLGVMVIVPTGNDRLGDRDLAATSGAFFARYTAREKGCKLVAEIGNEDNLTMSPQEYAATYNGIVPEIRKLRIPVIASGTSELDVRWAKAVSALLPQPLPDAYGFHPYDVPPERMQKDVATMAAAVADGDASRIVVTEYGSQDAATLSNAILTLATQPAVTVYEYRCQPSDDGCKYGLKDHPALFEAAARAFAAVRERRAVTPANGETL